MAKPKNKVYLVEVQPGTFKKFTNWADCQALVTGTSLPFAGGKTEAEARTKIEKAFGRSSQGRGKVDLVPDPPSNRVVGWAKKPTGPDKSAKSAKGGKGQPDKPKNNFYMVELEPGTYKTFTKWRECQAFVKDKKLPFAGGVTEAEAREKIERTRDAQLAFRDGKGRGGKARVPAGPKPTTGICSDAGTHGNPGPCEYQVTDLKGKVLDHKHLGIHTNNYAELAGIEAMIHVAVKCGETELWTDSQICLGWIKKGKVGEGVHEPHELLKMIGAIQALQKEHPKLELKKWHTKAWGEIPADFGRK